MKVNGETTEDNRDSGVLSSPLSFLRSGYFGWNFAGLDGRGGSGYYWSLRSGSATYSGYLYFDSTYLSPQDYGNRGNGFAVRCVGTSKSFTTLINTSYSMKNCGRNCESNQDSGVLSEPLSFLRNGDFNWGIDAIMSGRGGNGDALSLRSSNTTLSNGLFFSNIYLFPQHSLNRGNGFAVRCVATSPNPSPLSLILAIL